MSTEFKRRICAMGCAAFRPSAVTKGMNIAASLLVESWKQTANSYIPHIPFYLLEFISCILLLLSLWLFWTQKHSSTFRPGAKERPGIYGTTASSYSRNAFHLWDCLNKFHTHPTMFRYFCSGRWKSFANCIWGDSRASKKVTERIRHVRPIMGKRDFQRVFKTWVEQIARSHFFSTAVGWFNSESNVISSTVVRWGTFYWEIFFSHVFFSIIDFFFMDF